MDYRPGFGSGFGHILTSGVYTCLSTAVLLPVVPIAFFSNSLRDRLAPYWTRGGLKDSVWWHGASAGEVRGLVNLVRQMAGPTLLSSTTLSGLAMWDAHGPWGAPSGLLPADAPPLWRRVLKRVRPRAIVVSETEMWPGLMLSAASLTIPLSIVSARLSEKSFRWYRRLASRPLAGVWKSVFCCAQNMEVAERYSMLGVPHGQISVTGCLKKAAGEVCDRTARRAELGLVDSDKLLVAGSIHREELPLVLPGLCRWLNSNPFARAVIAPRKVTDANKIASELARCGVSCGMRTDHALPASKKVMILNTMGELAQVYAAADTSILGNTFESGPGHNIYEAAAYGRPVIVGNCFNQPEAERAMSRDQLWVSSSSEYELMQAISDSVIVPTVDTGWDGMQNPVDLTARCLIKWGLTEYGSGAGGCL